MEGILFPRATQSAHNFTTPRSGLSDAAYDSFGGQREKNPRDRVKNYFFYFFFL